MSVHVNKALGLSHRIVTLRHNYNAFTTKVNAFSSSYEDDFEPDDDSPAPTPKSDERGEGVRVIEQRSGMAPGGGVIGKGNPDADDIYDFTPSDLGYWLWESYV